MPKKKKELLPVTGKALARYPGLPRAKKVSTKLPKRSIPAAQARSARSKWLKAQKAPAAPKAVQFTVKAVRLGSTHLKHIRSIHESASPSGEFVAQKLKPDAFLSELYSALSTLEYTKMQSEYKRRRGKARTDVARKKVDAEWQHVVKAGGTAFQAGGLRGVKQRDLDTFARNLTKNKADFNAVANIAKTGSSESSAALSAKRTAASFVPTVKVLPDLQDIVIPVVKDICDEPLLDGKYTKHISKSFALRVRLRVWCPTWSKPWRTCVKTFTVAGASVSLNLEVGYELTCCGARAWGSAAAEACVTVVGVRVCASCTARITGTAGISRTGSGSRCYYGLGVVAELECKLGGVSVFRASVPFGWTVSAPCPPSVLPC